ncbi:MAG TPA: MFS transporter [Candidatus Deferrimicrobium sp.]|nr:MFS transporter [Candidatus Deferrimicrobium sp.]
MSALRRYARSFTGFERDARIFLVTTLIYGVALSLWWVDFNLYLTALGFDPAFIGISGTVGAVAGVLVAFPASILSDRLGRRIVLVLGAAGSTLAIAGLIVVTSPIAILACAAAMGAASQAIFVVQSPFLMEHSRPEHRNELFSLQSAILTMTSVGAALLGGAIAAIVGSVADIGTNDPAVYRVLLLVMAVAAAVATVTALALRDDRPRRRRDPRTLEQRPGDAWAGEPIASRPDRPPATRRVRLRIPHPSDPTTFWHLLIPGFLIALGAGQVIPYLNVFIEGKFDIDLAALNVIFAVTSLGTAFAIMVQPALARRFGKVGSVVLVQGVSIPFLVVLGFSPVLWTVVMAMAVRNSLMNAGNPIANAFAMEQLRPAERATYAATASLLWSLGWAIAGPWYSLLQATLGFEAGYTVNFVTVIVLYSLGTWLYWRWFHEVEERPARGPERAIA